MALYNDPQQDIQSAEDAVRDMQNLCLQALNDHVAEDKRRRNSDFPHSLEYFARVDFSVTTKKENDGFRYHVNRITNMPGCDLFCHDSVNGHHLRTNSFISPARLVRHADDQPCFQLYLSAL